MEITYLGHSCFKVVGKRISVLVDPFDSTKVGLKLGKQDADVVLVTHEHFDHNDLSVLKNDYILFDSPGEYEARESEFVGVQTEHGAEQGNNTIFAFEVDGVKICHLGDLGAELKSDQLARLDGVDVLMVPVGGKYTIDAKEAVKVIGRIEPKIVIPMHYKAGNMTDLADLQDFLSEMSVEPMVQEKLKLTTKDLPEKLEVITLKY